MDVNKLYQHVADKVKRRRKELGLTQKELAERLQLMGSGMQQPVISNIENAKTDSDRTPNLLSYTNAEDLAKVLEFEDADEILWGNANDEEFLSGQNWTQRELLISNFFDSMIRDPRLRKDANALLVEYVPFAVELANQTNPLRFETRDLSIKSNTYESAIHWVYYSFLRFDFQELFEERFTNNELGYNRIADRLETFKLNEFKKFLTEHKAADDSVGMVVFRQIAAVRKRQNRLEIDEVLTDSTVRMFEGENEVVSFEFNRKILNLIEIFADEAFKLQQERGRGQ
ncbi:helix-turn-helix transcriptional regulator [Weissella cibaria]|uniref:helix-turn-helix domain-containing protein n=1 Tax=Weissella cibaria TaxID=137591 RepID=UPI00211DE5FD|nr:helix-turn-helix transcriptional regulator [Weissella cibaria]MCQ9619247.1 helix-turn-helix transcriptional regulator [Weissella cibaria]